MRQVRPGDTLGRYELGAVLGEGGMATVFRARDRELRRDVAIKVLFPHLARRADVVLRFHREARAAAALEHPHILRIYDVGGGGADNDDPPYIVMELIRGRTLLQEIEQRGAMLTEIAACVGALLCDALAAAHTAGVIHRDVKPANVLIAPGGRLLLADFGVARLETEDSLVTRSGAVLGTPAYMSPEQAGGDVATARSDLYSLGATLYQLATGALPYTGTSAKVISQISTGGAVAPVRRRSSCGADLSRLIERLMAGDPSARPASAAAIATALRELAAAGGFGDATRELAAYFADPDGFLRTRTPTVVAALVAAANGAVRNAKLPRAMALADRASALAPADPTVVAVVHAVTRSGHASRRRRMLSLGGVAVAVVGGTSALGWRLASSRVASDPATSHAAIAPAPPVAPPDAPPTSPTVDATAWVKSPVAPPDDHTSVPAADLRATPGQGGHEPRHAAAPRTPTAPAPPRPPDPIHDRVTAARSVEAEPASEPPAPEPAIAPVATVGHVVVRNDVWCDIWIDQIERGNRRNEAIEVSAGHHVVRCVNPVGQWTQDTDVAPGATRTLQGVLLHELDVTLAVDAMIDGKHYARGAIAKLKPGNVEVVAGGKKQFITFRTSCTLRDVPELGCYL